MNPLYNLLNGQNNQQNNNIFNLMQQFKQFKSNFQGDPKQKVQELLKAQVSVPADNHWNRLHVPDRENR